MKNKMYLVLGDWSDDGHGKTDKVLYKVNHTVEKVQQAYKDSCRLTGISFNHNEDYTSRGRKLLDSKDYQICTEYQRPDLSKEVMNVLEKFKCPLVKNLKASEFFVDDMFADLWWWFVSLSLNDLQWEEIEDETPVINGYWNKNLNVQFGYGLYG